MSTLTHIVLLATDDKVNNKWIEDHDDKIKEFYEWLKNYEWGV